MNGVNIMIFLVRCTADVLVCQTVPVGPVHFSSMDVCRAEVAQILTTKEELKGTDVWMGKCVYQLASVDPRRVRRDRIATTSPRLKTTLASR